MYNPSTPPEPGAVQQVRDELEVVLNCLDDLRANTWPVFVDSARWIEDTKAGIRRAFDKLAALSSSVPSGGITHQQGLAIAKALKGEISHGKLAELLGIEDVHGFKLAAGSFDAPPLASGGSPDLREWHTRFNVALHRVGSIENRLPACAGPECVICAEVRALSSVPSSRGEQGRPKGEAQMVDENFRTALRVFELMPMQAKVGVLETFAKLRYPSVADRFHEAVYQQVVMIGHKARADHGAQE